LNFEILFLCCFEEEMASVSHLHDELNETQTFLSSCKSDGLRTVLNSHKRKLEEMIKAAEPPPPIVEKPVAPVAVSSGHMEVTEQMISSYSWDETAEKVSIYVDGFEGIQKEMVKV
jgi:hypothetical protein